MEAEKKKNQFCGACCDDSCKLFTRFAVFGSRTLLPVVGRICTKKNQKNGNNIPVGNQSSLQRRLQSFSYWFGCISVLFIAGFFVRFRIWGDPLNVV